MSSCSPYVFSVLIMITYAIEICFYFQYYYSTIVLAYKSDVSAYSRASADTFLLTQECALRRNLGTELCRNPMSTGMRLNKM